MFWNNIKISLRNLRKNKVFAIINIAGLAVGMTIYVFGGLLVEYEATHDAFFENSDRTYTVGSYFAPEMKVGIDQIDTAWSTIGPIIETELADVEAVARTLGSEYLVSMGEDSYYESIRFADPALLQIFDLDYIHGDDSALTDPSGIIVSETAAIKYFGKTDVMGEVVTFDNEFDYRITAVYEDVPQNSHFNSLPVMETPFDLVAPIAALSRMRDLDEAGELK